MTEMIGFPISSSASLILQHLQRHGQATIKELEEVLGVSTTAVREHLAHLQVENLVATSTVRRGPGRPRLVYTLTDKAQSLFPKQYDLLINLLLKEIAAVGGTEQVDLLLERVGKRLASEYSNRISSSEIQDRLVELRALLEARGIPAEVHQSGDGLHIFACPYFDVAQEHGEVCAMERQMLEEVLGGQVRLEHSIREGHQRCRFVIDKDNPRHISLIPDEESRRL